MKVFKIIGLMLKDFGGFFIHTLLKPILITLTVVVCLWAVCIPSFWVVDNVYPHIPIIKEFGYNSTMVDFSYAEAFNDSLKVCNFIPYAFTGIFGFILLIAPWFISLVVIVVALLVILLLFAAIFSIPATVADLWKHYSNKV